MDRSSKHHESFTDQHNADEPAMKIGATGYARPSTGGGPQSCLLNKSSDIIAYRPKDVIFCNNF
jgi:hypothetical protein